MTRCLRHMRRNYRKINNCTILDQKNYFTCASFEENTASMLSLQRSIVVFLVIGAIRSTRCPACPCSPCFGKKPPVVDGDDVTGLPDALKFDCFPAANANKEECRARGCYWSSNNDARIPRCYYPQNFNSYKAFGHNQSRFGMSMRLKKLRNSPYPNDMKNLRLSVTYESEFCVRVTIAPIIKNAFRHEPPYPIPYAYAYRIPENNEYFVLLDELNFGFAVVRRKTGKVIFDTRQVGGFVFSDKFLQLSALLPDDIRIYGLGEGSKNFSLNTDWQKITLFNRGRKTVDRSENVNLYGSHPFYLAIENGTDEKGREEFYSHGVLLFNSNAMDIILQPAPAITYRPIGGIFEFYFFLGPTPEDVIRQYTNIVAHLPSMPPYWSLGFHLSRFGLNALNDTRDLWRRNKMAGIPFDAQWNDIDYMDQRRDFAISPLYEDVDEFVRDLHKANTKYVLVLNPSLPSRLQLNYPLYYRVRQHSDVFIQNARGKPLEGRGQTQPEGAFYIDFFNPRASTFWCKLLADLHQRVNYDGLWLNMNELHNFGDGSINGCDENNQWDNPPYVPGVTGDKLYKQTICLSAKHLTGLHYDLHNVYGLKQCMETIGCMSEIRPNKRNFILSRSTFIGSGSYAAHWTGNNYSSWQDMKFSIADILSFSLFGIPMVGADICGYHGDATEKLCQRWLQLGAFYPFSRSHNHANQKDQDPAVWSQRTIDSTKKALEMRYKLLPYLYTLFFHAHTSGKTVARPLFFEFFQDPQTHTIDTQFMWGSAILIVPVLEEDQTNVTAYLPKETWYDLNAFDELYSYGEELNIPAPLDTIPLFIRAGHIVPFQDPAQNTEESRENPFGLYVALGESGIASGDLFWDNGDSDIKKEEYNLIYFDFDGTVLHGTVTKSGFETKMILNTIYVLGVNEEVGTVLIDSDPHWEYTYLEANGILKILNANIDLKENFEVKWLCEESVEEYWKSFYRKEITETNQP